MGLDAKNLPENLRRAMLRPPTVRSAFIHGGDVEATPAGMVHHAHPASNQMTIIAIDPGASGGIAWHQGASVNAKAMPDTRGDTIALLKGILSAGNGAVAYHEKINGYIPDAGPSMMFAFGASCERVSCILETLGVRIIEITPQAWQKALALGTKGLTKAPPGSSEAIKKSVKTHNAEAKRDWKNKLKAHAQRLFPMAPVTLKTCDAFLILEVAMRMEGGGVTSYATRRKVCVRSVPRKRPSVRYATDAENCRLSEGASSTAASRGVRVDRGDRR